MNKQIKRFLACVLIVSLSIISLTPVSAAKAFSGTVAPFYNNVASATAKHYGQGHKRQTTKRGLLTTNKG